MLNKRVQVLFESQDYVLLEKLAAARGASVGELIRGAAQREISDGRKQELARRKKNLKSLVNWRKNLKKIIKGPPVTTEEILNWIHKGRKYE